MGTPDHQGSTPQDRSPSQPQRQQEQSGTQRPPGQDSERGQGQLGQPQAPRDLDTDESVG